ncbi:protealysin inhibitor emfourin [Pseudonocardia sp. H11422]|uniref:protealysin inhibitor emfourin n=1 Tax=Pseudonocardia sp. H11422 TaxID=2835866 RepID=UPI001BDCEEB6|nr:protealysin inhibitor emfourin [Pseudonocardia sp. H11422]
MAADEEPLRVSLVRSGGLLGTDELETVVTAAELDPEERALLENLVEQARVGELAVRSPIAGRGADVYQYELTVERGQRRDDVVISQSAVPENLRPLLRWLERRDRDR